jgi:hypothetical protein
MRRHLRHCQASIIAFIAHCQAGIVALVVMALLLSMHSQLHRQRDCDCHPHDDGVVTVVDAQASLPSSSWGFCPRNNGVVALDS